MYFLCLWVWYEDGRNPFHVFNIRQIEDYPKKKNTKRMPIKYLNYIIQAQEQKKEWE